MRSRSLLRGISGLGKLGSLSLSPSVTPFTTSMLGNSGGRIYHFASVGAASPLVASSRWLW